MIRARALSLSFILLASCGGGGGNGNVSPPPPATAARLFIGDRTNATIGSSSNLNPPPGTFVFERNLVGANTQLDTNLFDFALDAANDRLYVADLRSILVFNNASTLVGNVAPTRTVSTIPGLFGAFNGGIQLDAARNILYAATNFLGATQNVQVFDNASTASAATASRTLTFSIRTIGDIALDATRNILYVYGTDPTGFSELLSFDNASTLSGAVTPNRVVSFPDSGGTGPIGIFIDSANDRLYVPRSGGTIAVFNGASMVSGNVTTTALPARNITLPVSTFSVVFVDVPADRLYAVDAGGISIIAGASTASGTPATTRATAPGSSAFQAIALKP